LQADARANPSLKDKPDTVVDDNLGFAKVGKAVHGSATMLAHEALFAEKVDGYNPPIARQIKGMTVMIRIMSADVCIACFCPDRTVPSVGL
jgi:hypothetical protein